MDLAAGAAVAALRVLDDDQARLALGVFKPRQRILGAELSGDIEETGKSVTRFKPGDQVTVKYVRNGKATSTQVTLGEWKS